MSFKISLLSAAESTVDKIFDANAGDVLLNENGQFADPSQVVDNVTTWWEKLNLVDKIIEKIPALIIAIALIFIGLFLSKIITKLLVKAMKAKHVDPSVYNFIKRSVSVLIKGGFILSALSMFFNIGSLVTAIGAAGVAASLGLQDSVAQFASGIQILLNHPFKNGDFVEVNGIQGNVSDIRFMNTVITTVDNKRIIIPNSHITTNHIINYSAENIRRIDLIYSIGYTEDMSKAKNVIMNVATCNELILDDPAPQVYVNSHESSSINLVAKIWCKGTDYWDVYYQMQEQVKLAFDSNGISIPFNQLDVHVKNDK